MKNILKQYEKERWGFAAVRRVTIKAGIATELRHNERDAAVAVPRRNGSVLVLTLVALIILSGLGIGMLAVAYGVRHRAIMMKNEATAMLAAEAGYEKSVFWMTQQPDMLTTLYHGGAGSTDTLTFQGSDCDYSVTLYSFINARPVFRIVSNGHSGTFNRKVDVLVMQAIGGWDMGKCRIPSGATTTAQINFVNGEVIDIPVHINNFNDNPDLIDIYITGSPQFLGAVAMGESRYTTGGSDKYSSVINLFNTAGIYFNQPDSRVTDEASVQSKVDRFSDSTDASYKFQPNAAAPLNGPNQPAVHLEFFVDPCGVGKVRITNNCTVRVFRQSQDSRTYDYRILAGSNPTSYERYYIYAYHVEPNDMNSEGQRVIRHVEDTYVTQSYGSIESEPGGQIFVNGNVIVGSGDPCLLRTPSVDNADVVKGKITVVATGNIWVANSIVVDGAHDVNGPTLDNPNVLGLFAQRVVKVVDPGMSQYTSGGTNNYPGPPASVIGGGRYVYVPIGLPDTTQTDPNTRYNRHLQNPMVVEAAITDGGGGWGVENVKRGSYGGRKNGGSSTTSDTLTVRGTFTDVMRGIVGSSPNGYLKDYHLDERLLEGILPGDIGLQGKYIATPAGWHDYRN